MSTSSTQLLPLNTMSYFDLSDKENHFRYENWRLWQQTQGQKSPYFDMDGKKSPPCNNKFFFDLEEEEEEDDCSSIEEEEELVFEKSHSYPNKQQNTSSLLSQMLVRDQQSQAKSQPQSQLKRCQSRYQHLNEWFSCS